jgi:hypothetical protein
VRVRRQTLSDGRSVVVTDAGPDNCGRAKFIAVLHDCLAEPVRVPAVDVTVRGDEPFAEAHWIAWDSIPAGGERRLLVEPRGVGTLTVTFRVESGGAVRPVEGHAQVRRVMRTLDEGRP